MNKLWLALKVLRKGEELQHPATWKTVSALTAALAVVFPDALELLCLLTGYCPEFTSVEINQIVGALANLGVGGFILYTIVGSSKKIGV